MYLQKTDVKNKIALVTGAVKGQKKINLNAILLIKINVFTKNRSKK